VVVHPGDQVAATGAPAVVTTVVHPTTILADPVSILTETLATVTNLLPLLGGKLRCGYRSSFDGGLYHQMCTLIIACFYLLCY